MRRKILTHHYHVESCDTDSVMCLAHIEAHTHTHTRPCDILYCNVIAGGRRVRAHDFVKTLMNIHSHQFATRICTPPIHPKAVCVERRLIEHDNTLFAKIVRCVCVCVSESERASDGKENLYSNWAALRIAHSYAKIVVDLFIRTLHNFTANNNVWFGILLRPVRSFNRTQKRKSVACELQSKLNPLILLIFLVYITKLHFDKKNILYVQINVIP